MQAAPRFRMDDALPGVKVVTSPVSGRGVVAAEHIAEGSKVMEIQGKRLHRTQANPSDHTRHLLQIEEDHFLLATGTADDFINHSCAPNLATDGHTLWLYALRDIEAGEELFFDYRAFEEDTDWRLPCACGTPACTGVLTGFPAYPASVRQSLYAACRPYLRKKYPA